MGESGGAEDGEADFLELRLQDVAARFQEAVESVDADEVEVVIGEGGEFVEPVWGVGGDGFQRGTPVSGGWQPGEGRHCYLFQNGSGERF